MKFEKHMPTERLQPYIRYFVVSENEVESEYKVLPSPGLVIGFQYRGRLAAIQGSSETRLSPAGITGISDSYKIFKNSAGTGTILVYFTELGFTHFAAHPAHELFNLSLSLDAVFDKHGVRETEEKLALTTTDRQRIQLVEQFLLSRLRDHAADRLVVEAVRLIYRSKGAIRVKELNAQLCISQSPFEKRFRKVVGTTPKKFASVVRFNSVLNQLQQARSLTEVCYANDFFDQAHFIKDFKQFAGDTPEQFRRFL